MMKLAIYGVALGLGLALCAPAAFADPIETITFSGTAGSGSYQSTPIFSLTPSSLAGDAFSVALTFDPAQLINNTNKSCTLNCQFNFIANSSVSESITINSVTKTYTTSVGGNSNDFLTFIVSGNASTGYTDEIKLNIGGSNQLTATLPDATSLPLFSSQTNVNSAYILENVSSQTLTGASFTTNIGNSDPGLNGNGSPLILTTSNIPEPASLGLLGAGLLGLGIVTRRKSSPRQMATAIS